MTPTDILPILQRWAETITAAEEAFEPVSESLGSVPEAPLPTALYALYGLADEWAGTAIGCGTGWIEWYRIENSMGERGHEAGFDGELKPIRTLEDLAELLAEDLRRADMESVATSPVSDALLKLSAAQVPDYG